VQGRILGIDYGLKRVGLSVSDTTQTIANGLKTLPVNELMNFLESYVEKENIVGFVVGYPKRMNNQPSESAQFIDHFLKHLKTRFPKIPVELMDERFTSKIAFQTMIDSGLRKKQRRNKALIDTISATIILQSYLDKRYNLQK
jgi:putative Holliday junction resolvase